MEKNPGSWAGDLQSTYSLGKELFLSPDRKTMLVSWAVQTVAK